MTDETIERLAREACAIYHSKKWEGMWVQMAWQSVVRHILSAEGGVNE